MDRGVHPMEGNEAEIFIIPILGGKFGILGGKQMICQFRRGRKCKEFLGGKII